MKPTFQIAEEKGNLVLREVNDFCLDQIMDCGQAFRFLPSAEGIWHGVALGRVLALRQTGGELTFFQMSREEFEAKWFRYFALDEDYAAIKTKICTDCFMAQALEMGGGIRILKQELWEMLITFLLSQNNNIPRIRRMVQSLCAAGGAPLETEAGVCYDFPSPQALTDMGLARLGGLGLGYRDKYVYEAARRVSGGELNLSDLTDLPTGDARRLLMELPGIGGKVADCILLFGMARYEVCPHDVWVKRIFTEKYEIKKITEKKGYAMASQKWGELAGIAQQYLFYAARGQGRGKNTQEEAQ